MGWLKKELVKASACDCLFTRCGATLGRKAALRTTIYENVRIHPNHHPARGIARLTAVEFRPVFTAHFSRGDFWAVYLAEWPWLCRGFLRSPYRQLYTSQYQRATEPA